MVMFGKKHLAVVAAVAVLAGCSPHYQVKSPGYSWEDSDLDLNETVRDACGDLMGDAKQVKRKTDRLLVASFANMGALNESSKLGRLMASQCGARIVDSGYQVVEVLLSESIYIDPDQGEFLLTRDLDSLAADYSVDHVVVGTYTAGADRVYVNAKVIRSADAVIMAATSFDLPVTNEVRGLLSERPPKIER